MTACSLFLGAPAQAVKVEFKRTGDVRVTSTAKTATDVGYVHTGTSTATPWYSDNGLTVAVFDQFGAQVGAGTAKCVMFRQGQPVGY
ncbi:hypothetical protein [Paractinoplanes hotanensis]|uniref:Uncharacterized protein n=1 Tax=Paractinoplanes hotanensis TaxID=2906497 RepID=A0ABT0XY71_9ACTN|nr:hypothetical protein [Actinoplanes hotanensis]MCM4078733.1 hypothetical protein [Actinoplanes hotanensis]